MASPHLLLFCLGNRSWSTQRKTGGPPRAGLTPSLFSVFTALLGFILSHGFDHLLPIFYPLSVCGGTGLQGDPLMCQSPRDSNGGAEKPGVRLGQWAHHSTWCGAGLVWPSFCFISSLTCPWALPSLFLLKKDVEQ